MELMDLLRYVELFQGVPPRQMKKLAACFETQSLKQGEVLFRQGENADRLYIIQSGFVEVMISGRVVGILGQGQSIGEIAWLDRSPRSGTVRAVVDTVIPSISFDTFTALYRKSDRFGHCIMRNIAADLSFRLRQRTVK